MKVKVEVNLNFSLDKNKKAMEKFRGKMNIKGNVVTVSHTHTKKKR